MIEGHPAQYATIYVYAPGCEFKTYDLELSRPDTETLFECKHLPTKIVQAFLAPAEIPQSKSQNDRKLEVMGELEANWMCSDVSLRKADRRSAVVAASCFVPSIWLGSVGTFNPTEGGKFEIRIPDFTKDPAFKDRARWPTAPDFGVIALVLKDERRDSVVETITAKGFDTPQKGLEVRSEYPNPIVFTRVLN